MDISRRHGLCEKFCLPVDDTNPKILRRLETRLLVRDTNGYGLWRELQMARGQFATPTWSPPESHEDITIKTADRHAHAELVLSRPAGLPDLPYAGFRRRAGRQNPPAQRRFQISGRRHRQPASHAWNHLGFFDAAFDERKIFRYPRLVSHHEHRRRARTARALLSRRQLLACAIAPAARTRSLTRALTRRSKSKISSTARSPTSWASPARKSSCPATPNKSILFHRISIVGENQMPPLAQKSGGHQCRRRHRQMDHHRCAVRAASAAERLEQTRTSATSA